MNDPFAPTDRRLGEPDPRRLPAGAGPVVALPAPAGGSAWVATDPALARAVLTDGRIVKDTAWAPPGWDARTAGLEPSAADQASLTALDGPAHTALRRAHAPLFAPRRMREHVPRVTAIARDLFAEAARDAGGDAVDLVADLTTRYPLTVLLDLLGVPLDRVDRAAEAARAMHAPEGYGPAVGAFMEVAAAAVGRGGGADELRAPLGTQAGDDDLRYHLFGLIFAGQLTTAAALGFLLAEALRPGGADVPAAELVERTLREHPPAPFGLWRFTRCPVELDGRELPARSPVLVDLRAASEGDDDAVGAFGAGPHVCAGAALARLELRVAVEVLRAEHPGARLAVPAERLRVASAAGIDGDHVVALPVIFGSRAARVQSSGP